MPFSTIEDYIDAKSSDLSIQISLYDTLLKGNNSDTREEKKSNKEQVRQIIIDLVTDKSATNLLQLQQILPCEQPEGGFAWRLSNAIELQTMLLQFDNTDLTSLNKFINFDFNIFIEFAVLLKKVTKSTADIIVEGVKADDGLSKQLSSFARNMRFTVGINTDIDEFPLLKAVITASSKQLSIGRSLVREKGLTSMHSSVNVDTPNNSNNESNKSCIDNSSKII